MFIIKYLKSLLYTLISMVILSILITILNYFNIIGTTTINYLKLLVAILSIFIGGIYIGKSSLNKGYLEGIKIGVILIIIFFLISYLGFNKGITFDNIIYYIIILTSSILGSIIGINKKSKS